MEQLFDVVEKMDDEFIPFELSKRKTKAERTNKRENLKAERQSKRRRR